MKCLFLTSRPGCGHTRAAEAIDSALKFRYPDIETKYLDITSLIDNQVSEVIQDGYLRMTAEQPDLYQKLYDLDKRFYRMLVGKVPAEKRLIDFIDKQQRRFYPELFDRSLFAVPVLYKSLDSALLNTLANIICNRNNIASGRLLMQSLLALMYRILTSRLKKIINEYEPDFLIATQMYPNLLVARLIEKGAISQPVIGVFTDYAAHGVWVRATTSLYCVSHDDAAESLRRQGVPASRIRVTGIPLMPEYSRIPTQAQARKNLGLSQLPTILITGGQCGIGVLETVKCLLQDKRHSYQVLVTSGSDGADMKLLQELTQAHHHRFRVFGWCNDISHLLCAADVVVGKPGGLTVSEALACGRPFIATCCLGGQEAHNVQFLREQGAGMQVDLELLPDTLCKLFNNTERLETMKRSARRLGRPNAAHEVVDALTSLIKEDEAAYFKHAGLSDL